MPGKARKLTDQEQDRLAAKHAIFNGAMEAARARFHPQLKALGAKLKAAYATSDHVAYMSLRAEFDSLAFQHKRFVETEVERRLRPDADGGELV
jgi:hypothetical protein